MSSLKILIQKMLSTFKCSVVNMTITIFDLYKLKEKSWQHF